MAKLGGILIILIVGMYIGVAIEDPPVEYRVRTETVTETVTEEVAVPAPFPLACQQVLRYADRLAEAGVGIDQASTDLISLFSDARLALMRENISEMNQVETKVRALEEITVGHVATIAEIKMKYPHVLHECKEQVEWQN